MSRADRIREAFTGGRGPGWRATDAYARAVLLGVGLVVLGALLHKVELVLFGAPFLVSALFALGTEVAGEPSVSVRPLPRTAEPGEATTGVEVDPAVGTELLAVRLPVPGTPGELGPIHLLPATSAPIVVKLRREAWGDGVDLRADHLFAGPDALLVHGPVVGVERGRVVLPPVDALPAGLLPARAAGLVGVHRTRRPGDSTELRDIRAFQPGDRLRRIDWRVSLRSPTLHVREHHAEADADVVLALDTRLDLGRAVADWSTGHPGGTSRPGGSLDTAVRAAASLAAGYLHQGDRVALADLGRPQLGVRPGVGRRQLLRLRNQLVVCARSAGWSPRPVLNAHQVPHGALVVVLSPFLDDHVVQVTVQAARRGSLVLAVDVLPADLRPDPESPWGGGALRIIRLEQRTRLAAMKQHGIAVVPWDGHGAGVAAALRRANRPGRPVVR
ncbi:DUF58 domain-containing protein [Umezawaea tangerina]|uniref:Uncharacterized protein (DUF58 family) n=1 Tax=Umezawaea tangerina TaxID=84725 RepID=A0A2T0TLT8_9PSEU|nr:DUF58 domain-containing protein [Umezawaea tangerina]PRY46682.1 uncharacterized protein (DUF58 family) [Umezawaea tangerina]